MSNTIDASKIFELKQEIARLLQERPEFIPFQKMIDERMEGAVSQHNRFVMLGQMMRDKLKELETALKDMNTLTINHVGLLKEYVRLKQEEE